MFNFRRRSPQEIAAHATGQGFLPVRFRPGLRDLYGLAPRPALRFMHRQIAGGVHHFSAGQGAPNLIVGLAGIRGVLMMGMRAVLEALDAADYDLLLLQDSRRLHFDRGIEGYASSMPDLSRQILALAQERGYRAIFTFGASSGGFPALRLGKMLGARRAISAGGRFVWHPGRIARNEPVVGAFDPLCACRTLLSTQCYALYSEGQADDARDAAMLANAMPQVHAVAMPFDKHNFPYAIQTRRRLDDFFGQIFDPESEPDERRLRALLE